MLDCIDKIGKEKKNVINFYEIILQYFNYCQLNET